MKNTLSFFILFISYAGMQAQSTTFESVYNLIQGKCASCHVEGHASGLVLNGTIGEVYANLYDVTPNNATAAGKGNKIVFPGDPYKSFLFTKINNGLAIDVNLEAGEGAACPQDAPVLDNKEIELVRQWILFGALESDTLVDQNLIADFYDNDGIQSITSPPAPPPPGEGFQIHYGPYFLWPNTENEYFSKFSTQIPDDIEINKIEITMGDYSHHFIIYQFYAPTYTMKPFGLRENDPEYLGVNLVTANQFSATVTLPQKTAFKWPADCWLDLDSHYVNYSSEKSMASEVYVNIYTQPAGTALQEMHTQLPANTDIYIPNDNMLHTFNQEVYDPGNNDFIYVWGMTSHTHKYGADYDIYKRNTDGTKGEKLFDASCLSTNGIPGCVDEIYDYKHPPTRFWDNFLPVKQSEGLIHEASYINNGPNDVWFGLTSADEMMVMIYFYIDDTTGLNLPDAIKEPVAEVQSIKTFPNPATEAVYVGLDALQTDNLTIALTNMEGRTTFINTYSVISTVPSVIKIKRNNLPAGMYVMHVTDAKGNSVSRKIIFQ